MESEGRGILGAVTLGCSSVQGRWSRGGLGREGLVTPKQESWACCACAAGWLAGWEKVKAF